MTDMTDAMANRTSAKPSGSPKTDVPQAFREMAEKGTAQAQQAYEKMTASTAQDTDLIKTSVSTALKGAQDYNNKVIELAQTNATAAFEFIHHLSAVKTPAEFMELTTAHTRKQFETMTEQAKELAALAQKVAAATSEPIKAGVTKAFGNAA